MTERTERESHAQQDGRHEGHECMAKVALP